MPGPHISDETEEDHPAWIRIKAMHDHGDFDKIDRMVKVWEGLEALGSMGSILAKFLMWCSIIGGAYLALTGHLAEWVRAVK